MNVTVKSLTWTNPNGYGLCVEGEEASVEMVGVSVKECGGSGLFATRGASVKATQCEFSDNRADGVFIYQRSKGIFTDCSFHHNGDEGVKASDEGTLVELRGEQTEIHHNGEVGLFAMSDATLNIHIPSQSITALIHDNGEEDEDSQDLGTFDGAKIQSQLSSSSLELTVIQEAPPEEEEDLM